MKRIDLILKVCIIGVIVQFAYSKTIYKQYQTFFINTSQMIFYDDGNYDIRLGFCIVSEGEDLPEETGLYELNRKNVILYPTTRLFAKNNEKRIFHIVLWGDREFIIEDTDIQIFCNSINSGMFNGDMFEPNSMFFQNVSDSEKQIYGKPQLSDKYKSWLFDSPIVGKVTETYPDSFDIKIDIGSNDGLFIGCRLYDNDFMGSAYNVIKLDSNSTVLRDEFLLEKVKQGENIDVRFQGIFETEGQILPSFRERYLNLKVGEYISTLSEN